MIAGADRWLRVGCDRKPAGNQPPNLGCTMTVC